MTYILYMLVVSVIVLGAFTGGFVLASYIYSKQTIPALKTTTEDSKPTVELTPDQKREIQKKQIEIQNFFAYNGDELPKPEDKIK